MPRVILTPESRSVRPRRDSYKHKPIIVVIDGVGCLEDGTPVYDLCWFAENRDDYIWVTLQTPDLIAHLHAAFGMRDDWQFKTNVTTHVLGGGAENIRVRLDRFGFIREGSRKTAMHMVWDPSAMTQSRDLSFLPGRDYAGLMEWALAFRDLHEMEDMALTRTLAGVSAKWLKDGRFWPDARRRVPQSTNEHARAYLPGVHTDVKGALHRTYPAVTSLDQVKAYHTIAQQIALPNPNELHARGYFGDPLNCDKTWAPVGSYLYERMIRTHGLFFIRGSFGKADSKSYSLPVEQDRSFRVVGVWSNELPYLQARGFTVQGMVAALSSLTRDEGLSRYALHAVNTLSSEWGVQQKPWLKPMLHTTYGMLGARPHSMTVGYRYAVKGKSTVHHIGVHEYLMRQLSTREQQSQTANVVMYGMLQAEVRLRTARYANELIGQGVEVTQTHADGLHAIGALPFIPPEWEPTALTNVRYIDAVSWVSREKQVLPGRSGADRLQIIARVKEQSDPYWDAVSAQTGGPVRRARHLLGNETRWGSAARR